MPIPRHGPEPAPAPAVKKPRRAAEGYPRAGLESDGGGPVATWQGPDPTRHWVFATGFVVIVATVITALVITNLLTTSRDDMHRVTNNGLPAQRELTSLRTSVVDFQMFIETHLDSLTPGTVPSTALLAQGVQIVQRLTDEEAALAKTLRRIGLPTDASDLDAAIATFSAATTKLTPIAAGQVVTDTVRAKIVAEERAALANLWTSTTTLDQYLLTSVTGREATKSLDHLRTARTSFLVGVAGDIALMLAVGLFFGLRAGRRERARRREARRRMYEVRLQTALDMTASEAAVYDILGESLQDSTPSLQVELLIADSRRAHFRRALSNAGDFEGCGVVSPVDCPATSSGQLQLFVSSGALDACPHLKQRASGPCSATCNPVSIAGLTVGVFHAVGVDGFLPSAADAASLRFTSRRGTERIAMLRAFAASEAHVSVDSLTGMLNRRALENRVRDLRTDGVPYALAYGSLDHFKDLTDTYGDEAGDRALRLFARVLRDSVRPNDISARSGEDDFIVVLPECGPDGAVEVLERVREHLALALTAGRVPAFTVTFGLAGTSYATEFGDIVAIAGQALLEAQAAGRSRVVRAAYPDPGLQPADRS